MFRRFFAARRKKPSGVLFLLCRGAFRAPRQFFWSWVENYFFTLADGDSRRCPVPGQRQNLPEESRTGSKFLPRGSKRLPTEAPIRALNRMYTPLGKRGDRRLFWRAVCIAYAGI
jgi:hypothetical protein